MKKDIYLVIWDDITGHDREEIKKPFSQYLTRSYSIGWVVKDKNTTLVIHYGGDRDKEVSFDAIPNGCIVEMIKLVEEDNVNQNKKVPRVQKDDKPDTP